MKIIEVFTDGSCIKKKSYITSGYGIYFPHGELPNVSRKFMHKPFTNQRAELFAIYVALILIRKTQEFDKITIYSDSEYSIKCLTIWGDNWRKSGWKTADHKNVKNTDILIPLYEIYEKIKEKVEFKHVTAHTGKSDYLSTGNAMADKLATTGAGKNN